MVVKHRGLNDTWGDTGREIGGLVLGALNLAFIRETYCTEESCHSHGSDYLPFLSLGSLNFGPQML